MHDSSASGSGLASPSALQSESHLQAQEQEQVEGRGDSGAETPMTTAPWLEFVDSSTGETARLSDAAAVVVFLQEVLPGCGPLLLGSGSAGEKAEILEMVSLAHSQLGLSQEGGGSEAGAQGGDDGGPHLTRDDGSGRFLGARNGMAQVGLDPLSLVSGSFYLHQACEDACDPRFQNLCR